MLWLSLQWYSGLDVYNNYVAYNMLYCLTGNYWLVIELSQVTRPILFSNILLGRLLLYWRFYTAHGYQCGMVHSSVSSSCILNGTKKINWLGLW